MSEAVDSIVLDVVDCAWSAEFDSSRAEILLNLSSVTSDSVVSIEVVYVGGGSAAADNMPRLLVS